MSNPIDRALTELAERAGWERGMHRAAEAWRDGGQAAVEADINHHARSHEANFGDRLTDYAASRASAEELRSMRFALDELISGRLRPDA